MYPLPATTLPPLLCHRRERTVPLVTPPLAIASTAHTTKISKEHGGIMRYIQVSSLGASQSSPSRMLRAKVIVFNFVPRLIQTSPTLFKNLIKTTLKGNKKDEVTGLRYTLFYWLMVLKVT